MSEVKLGYGEGSVKVRVALQAVGTGDGTAARQQVLTAAAAAKQAAERNRTKRPR